MTKDASKIPGVASVLYGDVTGDLPGNVTGDLPGNVTGWIGDVTGGLPGNVTRMHGDLSEEDGMKIYQHMKPFLDARRRQREIAQELLRKQIEILNRESAQNHD